jgi:hypothetical protein
MRWGVLALSFCLAACSTSSGVPAQGFESANVERVYVPLSTRFLLLGARRGAAVIIAPGIAVTNAHNANLLDPSEILGTSSDYDLLFFHPDHRAPPLPVVAPVVGMNVIAYGEGLGGELRLAHGTVLALDAPVVPRCPSCGPQSGFTFAGDAGEGFSGGPVLDAATGALLGIVFGYTDDGRRVIYAYDMRRVATELAVVKRQRPRASAK